MTCKVPDHSENLSVRWRQSRNLSETLRFDLSRFCRTGGTDSVTPLPTALPSLTGFLAQPRRGRWVSQDARRQAHPSSTAPALLSPGSALPGLSHDTAHRTQDTICTALRVNNQSCPPQCAQFGVSGCPSPCLVASKGRHQSLPRAHLEPSCSPGLGSSDLGCQGLHPRDAPAG